MKRIYREIKTEEQLHQLLAQAGRAPLHHIAFQGLTLPEEAVSLQFQNCLFLACSLPPALEKRLTDSIVFPNLCELFSFRSMLYTAHSLYEGYRMGHPETLSATYDGRVYRHYLSKGKFATDVREALARTLHDYSISDALHEFLSRYDERDIVGLMGGHGISRTSEDFALAARVSKRLTEAGKLMVSGGGPGAMEATHLGAWMAGRSEEELQEALAILHQAPTYNHPMWLDTALQVRERFPQDKYESVGVPTWLYGHEPATPFATHIAKYFDNSIREDGILTIAKGGIIYTPGSAGTLQEIFQDAVQNHYLSFGYASPMAFLNRRYWTEEMPIYPLLESLSEQGKYKNLLLSSSDTEEEVARHILSFHSSV